MRDALATLPRHRVRARRPDRDRQRPGPVFAGVIGRKRFSYDLWGDTVNTASRMEQHGRPGDIQVTERTYERLREAFRLEPRGLIDVKGKGRIPTFLLLERRPAAP